MFWHLAASKAISRSAMHEAYTHISHATDALATLPATHERRKRLLELLIEKITPIMSVESYASPTLELLYQQAIPLYEYLEDTPQIPPLFYARWAYLYTSGRITPSIEQGREFIEVARRQQMPLMEAVGNRLVGVSLVWNGAPLVGVRHLDAALQVYNERASTEIEFRFGQDGMAAMQTYQAIGLCSIGQFKRGITCAAAALDRADQLGHALTTTYTHWHIGLLYAALGDTRGLARCINACETALAQERFPSSRHSGCAELPPCLKVIRKEPVSCFSRLSISIVLWVSIFCTR
jgi:hypothetical protein